MLTQTILSQTPNEVKVYTGVAGRWLISVDGDEQIITGPEAWEIEDQLSGSGQYTVITQRNRRVLFTAYREVAQ